MIVSHRHRFIFIKSAKCAGTSLELLLSQYCGPEDVVTPFFEVEPGHQPRNFTGRFNPVPEMAFMRRNRRRLPGGGSTPCWPYTMKDLRSGRKFHEAMPAWQLRCRLGDDVFHDYFSFAIERNPWDKVLSRVAHLRAIGYAGGEVTVDWLLDRLEAQRESPLAQPAPVNFPRYSDPYTGRLLVDHLCRYEDLNDELAAVFARIGIDHSGGLPGRAKAGYRTDPRDASERLTDVQRARINSLFAREISLTGYRPEADGTA